MACGRLARCEPEALADAKPMPSGMPSGRLAGCETEGLSDAFGDALSEALRDGDRRSAESSAPASLSVVGGEACCRDRGLGELLGRALQLGVRGVAAASPIAFLVGRRGRLIWIPTGHPHQIVMC